MILIQVFWIVLECQDPWYYKPELSLPACTNITHILGSYDKGPARFGWDSKLWDRQYMSEKGLSTIQRDGEKCLSLLFKVKQSYNEKHKYV